MTPKQIHTLRLLAVRPMWRNALPDLVAPRQGCSGRQLYWSAQASARMGGRLLAALIREGYVRMESPYSGSRRDVAHITPEGKKVLDTLDK